MDWFNSFYRNQRRLACQPNTPPSATASDPHGSPDFGFDISGGICRQPLNLRVGIHFGTVRPAVSAVQHRFSGHLLGGPTPRGQSLQLVIALWTPSALLGKPSAWPASSGCSVPAKWQVPGRGATTLARTPKFHEAIGVKTNQPIWRPPEARMKIG